MIATFLRRLAENGHGAQQFSACLCGDPRAEAGFCLERTMVIDRNCTVAELAVRLSAALVVATIYSRQRTWQQKRSRYWPIDRARLRRYAADMDISRVDLPSVCQRADDNDLHVVRLWWPSAAYPDPKERNFFEPFGEGLLHVDPDHAWTTPGDCGGGETEYDWIHGLRYFGNLKGGVLCIRGAVAYHECSKSAHQREACPAVG